MSNRHVLEHIATPRAFLHSLLSAAKSNATVFYVEVPNGRYTIAIDLVWDLIYEHCLHFTKPPLSRFFAICGYEVFDLSEAYGGQSLYFEASPASGTDLSEHGQQVSMSNLISLANRFGQVYESTLAHWSLEITRWKNDNRRVVLWGGGSKGVMFLNAANACASFIEHVIDINPRKHGKDVAGTGQSIVCPSDMREIKPDVILIISPFYRDEVANQLTEIGIAANISVVSTHL